MAQPPPLPGFVVNQNQPHPSYPPSGGGYPGYPEYNQNYHSHSAPPPQAPVTQQPSYHQPFLPPNTSVAPGQWLSNTTMGSFLSTASSFHVKQQVEVLEMLTGWETGNRYSIKDQAGNKIFYAAESNDCCTLNLCDNHRPFDMTVKDIYGSDVLRFSRPLRCSSCFCPCFLQEMHVTSTNGQTVGIIRQDWSICSPSFSIQTATGQTVLKIAGPWCPFACGGAVNFSVENLSGAKIGVIAKVWGGIGRELFTDADYFSISFPTDLDVNVKATCLGALFLIDYMYFESSRKPKLKLPWKW